MNIITFLEIYYQVHYPLNYGYSATHDVIPNTNTCVVSLSGKNVIHFDWSLSLWRRKWVWVYPLVVEITPAFVVKSVFSVVALCTIMAPVHHTQDDKHSIKPGLYKWDKLNVDDSQLQGNWLLQRNNNYEDSSFHLHLHHSAAVYAICIISTEAKEAASLYSSPTPFSTSTVQSLWQCPMHLWQLELMGESSWKRDTCTELTVCKWKSLHWTTYSGSYRKWL